jgi:hypothetical protein
MSNYHQYFVVTPAGDIVDSSDSFAYAEHVVRVRVRQNLLPLAVINTATRKVVSVSHEFRQVVDGSRRWAKEHMKNFTQETAYEALRLAQLNEDKGVLATSAKSAAEDAAKLFNKGDYLYCVGRAQDSLRYSVGVFHPEYKKFLALIEGAGEGKGFHHP